MRSNGYTSVFGRFLLLGVFVIGIFTISGCIVQLEPIPELETTTPVTTETTPEETTPEETTPVPLTTHPLDSIEVQFGVIHSLPIYLEGERVAIEIAVEDIHQYVQTLEIDLTFTPLFENAEGNTDKCVERFETLVARGVKFCIGPWVSAHCRAILEKANQEKILVISAASTAPDLAIPDDWLYRMPVIDQGPVIARMIIDYGIEAIILIQSAESWFDGLFNQFEPMFEDQGGIIVDRIRYDPDKTEFGAETELLNNFISEAIAQYGDDNVGVLLLGFENTIAGIQSAASGYPTLMSVPWFGSDLSVKSSRMIEEQAEAAVKVRHISPLMGVGEPELYAPFAAKYQAVMGKDPEIYDTLTYDSVWLLAKAILESTSTDSEIVKSVLPTVAANYYGASGWCKFNVYGDREAANFDIWAIIRPEESSNPSNLFPHPNQIGWEVIGVYKHVQNRVTWSIGIPLPVGG